MKPKRIFIFITLLLIVNCVKSEGQEISRLKAQAIILGRNAPKDKTAARNSWILVETDGRKLKVAEFKGPSETIDSLPSTDVMNNSSNVLNVGQVQVTPAEKRSYSLRYGGLSQAAGDLWLQILAVPVRGMGLATDMGQMKWEQVDRMPELVLKPITSAVGISISKGMRTVGPEGLIVRAVAGHIYAAEIKDDRTDYRVIFRIDSIDSNGDCSISWKRIRIK